MATETAILPQPTMVTMVWLTCGDCGLAFGLAEHFIAARRRDGRNFHCPNGHERCYRVTTEDQLRSQLASVEASLKFARDDRDDARKREDSAVRRERAQKANVTKLKKRAHAGVCAHCNRTFENVARHMKTKHPEERLTDHLKLEHQPGKKS